VNGSRELICTHIRNAEVHRRTSITSYIGKLAMFEYILHGTKENILKPMRLFGRNY